MCTANSVIPVVHGSLSYEISQMLTKMWPSNTGMKTTSESLVLLYLHAFYYVPWPGPFGISSVANTPPPAIPYSRTSREASTPVLGCSPLCMYVGSCSAMRLYPMAVAWKHNGTHCIGDSHWRIICLTELVCVHLATSYIAPRISHFPNNWNRHI